MQEHVLSFVFKKCFFAGPDLSIWEMITDIFFSRLLSLFFANCQSFVAHSLAVSHPIRRRLTLSLFFLSIYIVPSKINRDKMIIYRLFAGKAKDSPLFRISRGSSSVERKFGVFVRERNFLSSPSSVQEGSSSE